MVQPKANQYKTSIVIDCDIPNQQQVKYIPGVLQTLKFAWIQYLSLALVSFWIFYGIAGFIFRHKIVDTAVSSDLVSKKRF